MLTNFNDVVVGTKLRIRDDLRADNHYGGIYFNRSMEKHNGEIVFVTGVRTSTTDVPIVHVGASVDTAFKSDIGVPWVWSAQMFECIVNETSISLYELFTKTNGAENESI